VAAANDDKTNTQDPYDKAGVSQAESADSAARAAGTDQKMPATDSGSPEASFYKDDSAHKGLRKVLLNKKRSGAIFGVVGTGFVGSIIGLFMFSLPLKIVHIVTNLEDRAFAAAEQASEDMADNLLRHYIVQQLVPGMIANNCTTTRVSRSCANTSTSTTIVGVLFNSWRDGKIENKLANNHDIEVRREGNRFFLYTSGSGRTDLGEYNSSNTRNFENKAFRELSRTEIRQEIRRGFEAESFSKRIMYRYSVGGLLERKYGIRRCITACVTRDKISDKIDVKKVAFKSYFVERVVIPRNEALGLSIECAINGYDCANTPDEADENGERRSQFEQDLQARLAELRATMGQEELDALSERTEDYRNRGMIQVGIESLVGETGGKILTKGVPIVGWIDLGVKAVSGAQAAGPAITKMAYVTNSTTAIAMFQLYRTSADEIKTGEVDATIIGSVSESLGPNPDADQGGGGAEKSPVYDELMGGQRIALGGSGSVYAAEKQVTAYKCDDGKYPDNGTLCPEETLGNVNGQASETANRLSAFANSPMFQVAFPGGQATIEGWKRFVSPIIDGIGVLAGDALDAALSLVPGYGDLKAKIDEFSESVVKSLATWMIPSPISDNPSGARNYNMAAVGSEVAGNDFTHYSLGGKRVSDQDMQNIRNARANTEKKEFNSQSFAQRMFNTDSKYSVVSRIAISMPSNTTGVQQTMASIFSNPFGTFASLFGGLFSPTLSAQTSSNTNPAGITPVAYDPKDPVFKEDPDATWQRYDCDNPEVKKKWGEQGVLNPETQQIEHDVTNPCALLRSSISSAGGKYNKDLLESPPAANGSESTDNSASVSGSTKELAQQILDLSRDGKIVISDYSSDPGSDRASRSLASQQLEDLAAGKGARSTTRCGFDLPATITPDEKILKFLVDLGQTEKYTLNSLFGQCHSRTSNHYSGKAVDFGCPLNTGEADRVGQKYGVSHNFENCSAHGHWHYSVGGN
jgi:hypothetical protein